MLLPNGSGLNTDFVGRENFSPRFSVACIARISRGLGRPASSLFSLIQHWRAAGRGEQRGGGAPQRQRALRGDGRQFVSRAISTSLHDRLIPKHGWRRYYSMARSLATGRSPYVAGR